MQNFSLTFAGLSTMALLRMFAWADIDVMPEQIEGFISTVVNMGAFLAVWYGRFRKGDITWYGKRK